MARREISPRVSVPSRKHAAALFLEGLLSGQIKASAIVEIARKKIVFDDRPARPGENNAKGSK